MDYDLIFVVGVGIIAFGIPAFVSAYSDRRWPTSAIVMFVLGGLSVGYAMQENPDVYTFDTLPDTIVSVIGRYLG